MKVRAKSGAVLDVCFAQQTGQRRYIGCNAIYAWKESELPANAALIVRPSNEFLNPGAKALPFVAWVHSGETVDVPADRYHMKAIAAGLLELVKEGE